MTLSLSRFPCPLVSEGTRIDCRALTKKHEPGSEVANSQDTAAKEEEDEGENSKANTK